MTNLNPDSVLEELLRLSVEPSAVVRHGPTATLAEQEEAVSGRDGVCTKNLFFKDGRQRFYLCTCVGDTKVDHTKVLPIRLGLTKKEFKWADPSELQTILGVPPGCVTPLAAAQPTASRVVLLLDQRLRAGPFFVHPLDNSVSVKLTHDQLEAFLRSHGREAHFVDFSIGIDTELKMGPDNPPDLRQIADTVPPLKEKGEQPRPAPGPGPAQPKPAGKQAAQPSSRSAAESANQLDSVPHCASLVINKVLAAVGVDSAGLAGEQLRRLTLDVEVALNAFRNASYARGSKAAKGAMLAHVTREWD